MNQQEYTKLVADLRGPTEEWNDEDRKCKHDPEREITRTTMCQVEKFDTIYRHYNDINKLNGDIVDCGIWQGGMSIFLAKLFQEKNIWMCDSFEGFQPLNVATYKYNKKEPHTPAYQCNSLDANNIPYNVAAPYDSVIRNLARFELQPDDRIKILKGWVKDTLHPDNCDIKNIALLRIDVDSYSATREVLEHCYDKVVPGGFVIFDDSCLPSANDAMLDFFEEILDKPWPSMKSQKGVFPHRRSFLRHRETDQFIEPRGTNGAEKPCGSYMIKPNLG